MEALLTTRFYSAEDFSCEELDRMMASFEAQYHSSVEEAVRKVLAHEVEIVREIVDRTALYDEEDLAQHLRLAVYQQVPWMLHKNHLDPEQNIQGLFYVIMRNALMDLYRRSRRRRQTELPFEVVEDHSTESDYDIVEAKSELESIVMVLMRRLQHVESELMQADPGSYLRYLCWWLSFRADYLSGAFDPHTLTESELRPTTRLFEPDR